MSGRLTISTKKSYCPWSSANVTKYQREEERQRELKRNEGKKLKVITSRKQRNQLFLRKQEQADATLKSSQNNDNIGHVHLFPPPAAVSVGSEHAESVKTRARSHRQPQKMEQSAPFYLFARTDFSCLDQETTSVEKELSRGDYDDKEKLKHDKADPMRAFHRHDEARASRLETSSRQTARNKTHRQGDNGSQERMERTKRRRDEANKERFSFDRNGLYSTKSLRGKSCQDSDSESSNRSNSISSSEQSKPMKRRKRNSSEGRRKKERKKKRTHPFEEKKQRMRKEKEDVEDAKQQQQDKETNNTSSNESVMDELRRKRLDRELREQDRQSRIINAPSSNGRKNQNSPTANQRYNSQYYPHM